MASTKITEDRLLEHLTKVFQEHGYAGASLSLIAAATGLGRASLYHRFPGGKADMALAVLDRADHWFASHVLAPLSGDGALSKRVRAMANRLRNFYHSGKRSCLLHTLAVGPDGDEIPAHIERSLQAWHGAMEQVAKHAAPSSAEARRRASEALLRIQGALVVSRGLGDNKPFLRVLRELPDLLTGGDGD